MRACCYVQTRCLQRQNYSCSSYSRRCHGHGHDGCGGCAQMTNRRPSREGRPLSSTYQRCYWSACWPPSCFSRAWPASLQPSSSTRRRRVCVHLQALHVYDILPSNHSHKWLRHRSHWFAPPSLQTLPYLVMPRS